MLLAERAGVDPRAVKEALMGGFAASRMLDLQAPKMIARDFEGKVESRLHHKDIHIVLDLAAAFGITLPASAAAADFLRQASAARRRTPGLSGRVQRVGFGAALHYDVRLYPDTGIACRNVDEAGCDDCRLRRRDLRYRPDDG